MCSLEVESTMNGRMEEISAQAKNRAGLAHEALPLESRLLQSKNCVVA
jgi:hypothetical protein